MSSKYGCRWCSGDGVNVDEVLERPLLDKLETEVSRYQDKDFLKAAMAVCALAAMADDEVKIEERCCINLAIRTEPALQAFDVDKASAILDDYIEGLERDGDAAKQVLSEKVRRVSSDHKRARTIMRVAYLIITSDYDVDERELAEFRRLCGLLELEPDEIWGDSQIWSEARKSE